MMKKDLVSISDLSKDELMGIFDNTARIKANPFSEKDALKNKIVGLIFQKPSNRTRVSFEVGAIQLGGNPVYLGPDDIKVGVREPIKDIARVISRYMQLVVFRTLRHEDIQEFAHYADIPVINGLSDLLHPCQALADIFTVQEKLGAIKGKTLCFIGDGNNVLHSLLFCCSKLSMNVKIAVPKNYEPDKIILEQSIKIAKETGAKIEIGNNPVEAVKNADIIYTDVWISMGQEAQRAAKTSVFKGFQLNAELMGSADRDALVMHCLPAHRGDEITDEVIESRNSIVFDQAENRLHTQKAVMLKLLGGGKR